MSVQETSFVAGPRGNKKSAPKADIVGLTVALLLKPGFSLFINAFPGFNYIVLVLKPRIRVLKRGTKLRLKFVRVLSAVQAGKPCTHPPCRDSFCPGFMRNEAIVFRDLAAVK